MCVEWNLIEFQTTPGACFSKVPKLFGSISGDIVLFVSSKRRRLEVRNFAVIFIFIPFTTYEKKKTALQNKEVGVLGMAFRTGKVFGTFEKRAPGRLLDCMISVWNVFPWQQISFCPRVCHISIHRTPPSSYFFPAHFSLHGIVGQSTLESGKDKNKIWRLTVSEGSRTIVYHGMSSKILLNAYFLASASSKGRLGLNFRRSECLVTFPICVRCLHRRNLRSPKERWVHDACTTLQDITTWILSQITGVEVVN